VPNITTSLVIPPAVQSYFDRKLLMRALPYLAYDKVAQRRGMKQRNGNTIVFRRFEALALALAPLTEGSPPTGKQLSKTDIQVTIQQWGDYVTLTDFGRATVECDLLNEASDVLGEQAGQTMDALLRDVASAGTSVFYGKAAASRNLLVDDTFKVDGPVLDRAIRFLLEQNAKMFTEIVSASTKFATFPIRDAYIAITHPDVVFTLQEMPGWISVEEYASDGQTMNGEVGAYKNLRFLQTTQAKVLPGGGGTMTGTNTKATGGLADVFFINVFGKEAIATVPLDGMSMENIIKPLGSAGVADPLNQLSTSGWKHSGARKTLNDNFMCRIEVTATLNTP
jgi:N4-gp56 family major capsid protein